MGRSVFETILGALVLVVAIGFLAMAYQKSDSGVVDDGYMLTAQFTRIDGLKSGADVMLSGVKVGNVLKQRLNPETFMAELTLTLDGHIRLPKDTVALIASEGLMGGKYISLEVGGEEQVLEPGSRIQYTQTSPNLEQLLGQVIFSAGGNKDSQPAAAPATGTATAEPAHP
ncbi:MAG: outer membrane lipid asymmetry maintenance protein MlaD [Bdellovibrionales bacterium]